MNLSLSSGNIDGVKLAHIITPELLKGSSLNYAEFKSYRPISNLSFIGKLIERVVLRRLNNHILLNNLNIPFQSAYKKSYSTETLLVRIVNDLLIASSENTATIVMMLDLSAAFDTVDHNKLINILKTEIGISGCALNWFVSFITGRCQRVRIGEHESMEFAGNSDESKTLYINGVKIKEVSEVKFLGVIIDNKLNWSAHVKYLTKKLRSAAAVLCRIRHWVPKDNYANIYHALFESHLTWSRFGLFAPFLPNFIVIMNEL